MNIEKIKKVKNFMQERGINNLLLQRVSNFSWLTDGRISYVNFASDIGPTSILFTPLNVFIVTSNIESNQLHVEQNLHDWDYLVYDWQDGPIDLIKNNIQGLLHSDFLLGDSIDINHHFAPLRYTLNDEEIIKMKSLGSCAGRALEKAFFQISPGMTENQIAHKISQHCQEEDITPIVNLVAVDERILTNRHPMPTMKVLRHHVQASVCVRRWGLVASLTRSAYFGSLPIELENDLEASAYISSVFINHSRPNVLMSDVFKNGINAYEKWNVKDLWKLHHQGGLTGFNPREIVANKNSHHTIEASQLYAWNPIVHSAKSEDTILVTSLDNKILTSSENWPLKEFESVLRPWILNVK